MRPAAEDRGIAIVVGFAPQRGDLRHPAALDCATYPREKFTCRDCETISEPPAPFEFIPVPGSAPARWR
jgi:hypothetical protein